MPMPDVLAQLMRSALGRGGAAPSGTTENVQAGSAVSADSALLAPLQDGAGVQPPEDPGPEPSLDPGVADILAQKVLLAWLRNRYQLLFPFALDLRRLDEAQAELLVDAMVAAAQADGALDGKERERIEGALELVPSGEREKALLDAALSRPKPLNEVLGPVHDVQTGALVYAASLMTLDQRKPVNRHYLKYLAARLQLSEELAGSLEQRFRSSG